MSKNERGPADANNGDRVIKPTNSSQSFARGGGVMRHVEEQHRDHAPHDISGGAKRRQPVERAPGQQDDDGSQLGY